MLLNVCIEFAKQYNVQKGIVEVTVTSAVEVYEDLKNSIKDYLQSLKKGKIKLTQKQDKSLIAGFILDYDNVRLDASVKKRLDKMKKQLKATN
jgi:F-type H+-transporting ATPase subunit delta